MGMENLAVFTDEKEDPYLTNKDAASDSEDEDDFNLLPTDNLIAVGHVEGDAAILEIYGEHTLSQTSRPVKLMNFALLQYIMLRKHTCMFTMKLCCLRFLCAWNG